MAGLLSRERIIAKPGFNRWLVPPAALAIHLSIGMAYGFSVFWLPLSRAIGVHEPVSCEGVGFMGRVFSTTTRKPRTSCTSGMRVRAHCWTLSIIRLRRRSIGDG